MENIIWKKKKSLLKREPSEGVNSRIWECDSEAFLWLKNSVLTERFQGSLNLKLLEVFLFLLVLYTNFFFGFWKIRTFFFFEKRWNRNWVGIIVTFSLTISRREKKSAKFGLQNSAFRNFVIKIFFFVPIFGDWTSSRIQVTKLFDFFFWFGVFFPVQSFPTTWKIVKGNFSVFFFLFNNLYVSSNKQWTCTRFFFTCGGSPRRGKLSDEILNCFFFVSRKFVRGFE